MRFLVWDYETSGDLQTYFVSWEIIRKSSTWIFSGTTGLFWVQSLQTFFVWSSLELKDFKRLSNIFFELRDYQGVLNMDILWHNWLFLGTESPNIFYLVLFEIMRLQETYKHIL
jgi:hypothetical protein